MPQFSLGAFRELRQPRPSKDSLTDGVVPSREGRRRAVEGSVDQHDEAGRLDDSGAGEAGDQEPRVCEAERDENFRRARLSGE